MKDENKTKEQLLNELLELRQKNGELKESLVDLKKIKWLLNRNTRSESLRSEETKQHVMPYGNLTTLNTSCLILDSVGKDVLAEISSDYLDLLDTSTAIYERNGDHALGIFSSGWCRMLDSASRKSCNTDDNKEALESGKWHCHESCWTDVSKVSIETGQPVDRECRGGIRIYGIPIFAGGDIVGSINFGYGNPPKDPSKLKKISEQYGLSMDSLIEQSNLYDSRPPFIIEASKKRLSTSAKLIGSLVEYKKAEEAMRESEERFRSVAESANDAITSIDSHGNFIFCNKTFETTYGYSADEILGKPITLAMPGRSHEYFWNALKYTVSTGQLDGLDIPIEGVGLKKDGTEFPIEISVSSWNMGGKVYFSAITRDITERKQSEQILKNNEAELRAKTISLEEINTALKVLLQKREEDKVELEEKVNINVKERVTPFLAKLKDGRLDEKQVECVKILETNLNDIISSVSLKPQHPFHSLTPSEIFIANLVKEGKTIEEIAELLNVSSRTVEFHRQNIRKKFGLKNKKTNLRSLLLTAK